MTDTNGYYILYTSPIFTYLRTGPLCPKNIQKHPKTSHPQIALPPALRRTPKHCANGGFKASPQVTISRALE